MDKMFRLITFNGLHTCHYIDMMIVKTFLVIQLNICCNILNSFDRSIPVRVMHTIHNNILILIFIITIQVPFIFLIILFTLTIIESELGFCRQSVDNLIFTIECKLHYTPVILIFTGNVIIQQTEVHILITGC